MQSSDRALVSLDQGVFGALCRVGIGYLIVPAWSCSIGDRDSGWSLVLFFGGVLLALRVLPAILRKVIPFSEPVRTVWAERRQLAKRVDSYQWRKLFWIGTGLALFALQSGRRSPALLGLIVGCLAAGAVGLGTWRYRVARNEARAIE